MHPEAEAWVRAHAPKDAVLVLDIGGRNINGSNRIHFPDATFVALDILPGDGVDVVADAAVWRPDRLYDVVVCTEVFEHTDVWPDICRTAHAALVPDGLFIATMAGPGRPVHSAFDGGWQLRDGEHYANIDPAALEKVLYGLGFAEVVVDVQSHPADVRAVATRP